MLVKTYGSTVYGINATTITVEINLLPGAKYAMVGLPDNAVKESFTRIESALKHNGYRLPGKRIVINLAPADLKKEGSAYDLTIAIGILASSEEIPTEELSKYIIMGELSLDGTLQPIKGALPIAIKARAEGYKGLILPQQNAKEAGIVDQLEVYGVSNMNEVIDFFCKRKKLTPIEVDTRSRFMESLQQEETDFADVKGQEKIKRAMEIAAAGGHNIILVGPPGAGKTMLAKRLASILPPLSLNEALETTKIHSVSGKLKGHEGLVAIRPFRSPHHTVSDVALVGGGPNPVPGEISMAHNGVLFLDELPEFRRSVLEVMRQPLEERVVTISRARFSVDYPASFMLVASMNPCPCGYYNHPEKDCVCPPGAVQKYLNKISGPLLDRIDLHVEVTPVTYEQLAQQQTGERSQDIRARVVHAREVQSERFQSKKAVHANSQMGPQDLKKHCELNTEGQGLLKVAMEKFGLSARAFDRILKVARTIADLEGTENIESAHIAEAIQYRSLDRDNWG